MIAAKDPGFHSTSNGLSLIISLLANKLANYRSLTIHSLEQERGSTYYIVPILLMQDG
jgi:hypothetical protein